MNKKRMAAKFKILNVYKKELPVWVNVSQQLPKQEMVQGICSHTDTVTRLGKC